MSDDIETLKETEKEKLTISEGEFVPESYDSDDNNASHWTGGLILIGIGVIFLLANTTGFVIRNWWPIFILVPGVMNLANAMRNYQRDGRFSERVRQPFTWGLVLTVVACTFFFSWSWGAIWPVFLIIFGIGTLLAGLLS